METLKTFAACRALQSTAVPAQRDQDKRAKSLTQVPRLLGVRAAASHVTWLGDFLLGFTWASELPVQIPMLFAQGRTFQSGSSVYPA